MVAPHKKIVSYSRPACTVCSACGVLGFDLKPCPICAPVLQCLVEEMPQEGFAPIAEAKDNGESTRAPLRLMTQFLRAVSESRMEDALALAQTSRNEIPSVRQLVPWCSKSKPCKLGGEESDPQGSTNNSYVCMLSGTFTGWTGWQTPKSDDRYDEDALHIHRYSFVRGPREPRPGSRCICLCVVPSIELIKPTRFALLSCGLNTDDFVLSFQVIPTIKERLTLRCALQ